MIGIKQKSPQIKDLQAFLSFDNASRAPKQKANPLNLP
jgi:hypothetical protein